MGLCDLLPDKWEDQKFGQTNFETLPLMEVNGVQYEVVKHHGIDIPISISYKWKMLRN